MNADGLAVAKYAEELGVDLHSDDSSALRDRVLDAIRFDEQSLDQATDLSKDILDLWIKFGIQRPLKFSTMRDTFDALDAKIRALAGLLTDF